MDLRTNETFDILKNNYSMLGDADRASFESDLATEFGGANADRLVASLKSGNYDDYIKILDATLPEGTVENTEGETMGVKNNYDMSEEPMDVCPNCGSNPCMCQPPSPVADVTSPEMRDSVISDAVETTIQELQSLPPAKAQAIVDNFANTVSQEFSHGIVNLYNTRAKDFSRNMGILVSRYYQNLQKMAHDGVRDFSEAQNSDLYEYAVYGKPSDFSILNTMIDVVNSLEHADFSEEPSMIRNVQDAIEDERAEELLVKLDSIYNGLPSDEQKNMFLNQVMTLATSGQNINPEALQKEFSEEIEPEQTSEEVIRAQLANSQDVEALVEKYKSLSDDTARAAMRAAIEHKWGPETAKAVVDKAEGEEFSQKVQSVDASEEPAPNDEMEAQGQAMPSLDSYGQDGLFDSVDPIDMKLERSQAAATPVMDTHLAEGSLDDIASGVNGDIFQVEVGELQSENVPEEVIAADRLDTLD